MSGANLESSRLHGANLSGAFLFGARVSLKSLSTAKSLANATMPDGVKYEDWIRRQSGEYVPTVETIPTTSPQGVTDSPLDYTHTPEEV